MKSKQSPTLYWSLLECKEWHLYVAATSKGLCYVGSQNKPFEELTKWVDKHLPGSLVIEDAEMMKPYKLEIVEYLEGKRHNFTITIDYSGTAFQLAVWNALCEIPYGQVRTYTDIADAIQKPAAVRAVGAAIGANSVLIIVPCHRVVGKNGALTGYRGGLDMKVKLLDLEKQI